MKAAIRQNPAASAGKTAGEICPIHGGYEPSRQARALLDMAVAPGVAPAHARALLEESTRTRRYCPGCRGPHPLGRDWAEGIRESRPRTATALNRYAGRCPCGHRVEPGEGTLTRRDDRWVVHCKECS